MVRTALLCCLGCGLAAALQLPGASAATRTSSRRAVLGAAAAAATLQLPGAANAAKSKEYMSVGEWQAMKRQDEKDQKLAGLFEELSRKVALTGEFDKLAADDKMKEVGKLAFKWEKDYRIELLEKANDQLAGADKEKGKAINKSVLEDLKSLDKLAKANNKDGVAGVSAALKGHVLDFVALEPKKLQEKYGAASADDGMVGDL